MPFDSHSHRSLVTAILPRQSAGKVLNEVIGSGAAQAMTVNARGTLIQDRWYQSFLPAISPEQEILYFLVPNEDVDRLMEQIVMVGQLRLFGAGSIFAVDCEEFVCTKDFPLWQTGQYAFEPVSFAIKFKADLVNLVHVTDRGSGEVVARAALRAGAQGATITYVRGYGLRDRLGLLRITKSHDKELITVVVDQYDKDPVFEAMSVAGRVAQPGRGLIFQLPVSKGLTNLASVFQPNKHSASIQQMVRAIDDLHGGTDWRARQLMVRDPRANEFSASRRGVSKDLKMLNVVSLRKDTEVLLNHLLDYGVSGASVSNWRFTGASSEQTPLVRRSNREFGCISLIVNPHLTRALCESLRDAIEANTMKEACLFTQAVPLAKTFAHLGG